MEEEDVDQLRKEGYQSEDEIEEFLAQDIMDTRNHMKMNKIEEEVKRKFDMHRQVQ